MESLRHSFCLLVNNSVCQALPLKHFKMTLLFALIGPLFCVVYVNSENISFVSLFCSPKGWKVKLLNIINFTGNTAVHLCMLYINTKLVKFYPASY